MLFLPHNLRLSIFQIKKKKFLGGGGAAANLLSGLLDQVWMRLYNQIWTVVKIYFSISYFAICDGSSSKCQDCLS